MLFDDIEFGSYDRAEHNARRAFELYEDGQLTQALAELETALEINPANSALHFNKALTLDAINRFEEAITEYETALQLAPGDLEILNALAVDYTRTSRYDRALETFEDMEQLDREFEPSYCNRIITYAEMGRHDLAEQMFYLAQQIDPECPLCYYNIGNSLFARGEYSKAIRCWLRTAELEPTHPQIHYRIAQAYWAQSQTSRAHEHFLIELRSNPGDLDVILDFGLLLLETGNIDSAKEKFNRLLELKPDFALAHFYLGDVALDRGDYAQAIHCCNEAMRIDRALPGPRFRLAQLALRAGDATSARTYLLAEMRLESAAGALVSMGSMLLMLGDTPHAMDCLLRAIEQDQHNPDAHYYLALAHASKGQLPDAADVLAHVLRLNPEHPGALRDSASVALALGKYDQAAERIRAARLQAPNDRRLRAMAASIYLIRLIDRLTSPLRRLLRRIRPAQQERQ